VATENITWKNYSSSSQRPPYIDTIARSYDEALAELAGGL